GERGLAQLTIADRQGQDRRTRANGPGLVDQSDIGGMREARQITGRRRRADPDEAHVAVLQRPRRDDGHHLVGGEWAAHATPRRPWERNASGPLLRTLSRIQSWNFARSREMSSHAI